MTHKRFPADLPQLHWRRRNHSSIRSHSRGKSRGKVNGIRQFLSVSISLALIEGVGLIEIAVTHLTFETGSEKHKELETSVFVAAGRFIVEKDKPVVVEYKVSRVKHG
jgi:Protein of unknown function (DUF3237)